MSGTMKFTDSPEQAAVVQAPSYADVVVVAGAGSGKTYTMTRRIITLIEQGVSPEKILGLTFTRKAASELLSRVSAAVTRDQRERGLKSANMTFLKPEVSTYDAFFQSIVRQYGLLVGFDQNTQPLSEAGAMQLIHTVLDRHMDDLMAFDGDLKSFNTIAGNVFALSNAISGAMIGGDCTSFDEAVQRVRDWDEAFVEQIAKALDGETVPTEEPKSPKLPKRLKKDSDADYEKKLEKYRELGHDMCVFNSAQLAFVAKQRDLLLDLVLDYHAEKRACNMAEFSDFTIAAFQLVSRFPSIGAVYRKRYSHVLLDEYQDTSTTQAALLSALFHADDTHRSAVNAVGDPFQSIYAWRGASPGAFRMLQHDFGMDATSRPFALTVTRRNSRMVLEAANNLTKPLRLPARRLSSSLMREVDVPALVNTDEAPEGTVGVLAFDTFGQEVDAVVRFAKHAIALHTPSSRDLDNGMKDNRPHVAVLFRSKGVMSQFAEALERAGLTTLVVGRSALLERPAVQDVFALLRVVSDHTDSAALMRLLATPRFSISANDLQALADTAEQVNTMCRYRALVSAGIVQEQSNKEEKPENLGIYGVTPKSGPSDAEIRAIVREYRDQVPNAVFLVDLMLRDDLAELIDGRVSREGTKEVLRAADAIRQVQRMLGHPLPEVVREAIVALNLDIDMQLAEHMRGGQADATLAASRVALSKSPIDALLKLVDTYMQEIASQGTPSLRAFISWADSLRDAREENAVAPDVPVDVVLMTVHQSKGLEWDAVAVVGMTDGGFPTNKGSDLRVVVDEEHLNGFQDGVWTPPEYHETAKTWLTDPAAVPVPVRVDADILPRFPHDALVGGNPLEALEMLEDAEIIDDEVFGTLRTMNVDDMEGVDPDGLYLTQSEEYGRRLHADERRLAYVALTRARYEALLTYSETNVESRDPRAVGERKQVAKPSNFWQEVYDSMLNIVSRADEPSNLGDIAEVEDGVDAVFSGDGISGNNASENGISSLHSIGVPLPSGYFVGEHACDFEDAVVGDAWNAPLEPLEGERFLPWPCDLTEETCEMLRSSADQVRDAMVAGAADLDTGVGADAVADDVALGSAGSLLHCAQLLVDDGNLMPDMLADASQDAFDRSVRAQGEKILASGRQNVTSLQARAGMMNDRGARAYWRGLVRPIPNVASPAAQLGTQFHAWAERFIMADVDIACIVGGAEGDGNTRVAELRSSMLAEIERNNGMQSQENNAVVENAAGNTTENAMENNALFDWQQRLATSAWAQRKPAWAERQIVVNMPQLGTIVNGKLDAVFFGGLNEKDQSKQYTIVDWKTGKKPRKKEEIQEKLVQLDMYRLLLSAMEGVPLDAIDACLYYLSEPVEGNRQLNAADKTEEEILAELSYGIPEQSDND
ncbi:ATP-dependent DNA helicase [Bifidobacterium pseudocatenulatum]|uniref:ATP-dependent DNA helicase n=1 Tax=Bifidobacterium pseudocatenulatum TaxID=28026 RepID=UPI001CFEC550|nr:ATP-dependent DNA helicase [Bifidobacterium pseudocatenulatum]MCB4875096.1 UvrD-helicase domain-containing protein [Bifidobacterium pseudocatenulatum]